MITILIVDDLFKVKEERLLQLAHQMVKGLEEIKGECIPLIM